MSTPDLIDARYDELVSELRAARPPAPTELRERARALADHEPEPPPARPPRRGLPFRRLALSGAPVVAAGAVAAALVIGLVQSGESTRSVVVHGAAGTTRSDTARALRPFSAQAAPEKAASPAPTPTSGRAQVY